LTINITPRVDQFIIQTKNNDFYNLSNDGLVTGQTALTATGTLPGGLMLIKLTGSPNVAYGENLLPSERINFISQLQSQLPGIIKTSIARFELADFQTSDLTVYTHGGFELMFDLSSNLNETLSRLTQLI